ncbi:MAG: chorismate synthase [Bacteroidetes bacterium]|nr:chorismate synthase [Bacteroidota bacterium]
MAGNSIGQLFKLTTFGESHGSAIGGIIDGCPAGIEIDYQFINNKIANRKANDSAASTSRKEPDEVEFLSGIFENKSTGTPIAFLVRNTNTKSEDYEHLKDAFRPSHADYTYSQKYGIRDYRGGGRASARETIARVIAGALAESILKKFGISISAFVSSIGNISIPEINKNFSQNEIDSSEVKCPDLETSKKMLELLTKVKAEGDTLGGIISCRILNCPIGLGEPVFDKLHADLAKAMMSINAVKGFEYGSGFMSSKMKGSEMNDELIIENNKIGFNTNNSGGILGGISNGEEIFFNIAFKPISTLMKPQKSVNLQNEEISIEGKGRHDVCAVPRAIPIVEAMAALTLLDHFLRNKSVKI